MIETKKLLILAAVVLVLYCLYQYSNKNKEGYTANTMNTEPIYNSGELAVIENPLAGFMQPREPQIMQPLGNQVQSDDAQFARSFFFGSDHDRYDHLFSNPENVLNQRTRPVELAPNIDLPLGAGPEAYNAQRHEYRRLRSHLGYHRAVKDLNPWDLFGSPPQESLFVNASSGRPLQSMFNNVRDGETGILARLDRIKSRRDFDDGDITLPQVVPASGVNDLPIGANMASFSPVTGTLQIHDANEIQIPQGNYSGEFSYPSGYYNANVNPNEYTQGMTLM